MIALGLCAAYVGAQRLNPYGMEPGRPEITRVLFQLFDLDGENNIPTWYTSLLWAMAARMAWVAHRREPDLVIRRSWILLGSVFLLLSLDEAASLHERLLGLAGDTLQDAMGLEGSFYYGWVLLAGMLAMLVAALLVPFVLRIRRDVAACLVVAAILFLSGSLGFETISSAVNLGWIASIDRTGLTWTRLIILEELLEMTGPILAIHASLLAAAPLRNGAPAEQRATSGAVRAAA
ncbi:hypothetical protein [Phenylobacterium sp.]|uniref:hypothetical protein n=1 Tax=Phenylobacterium sp. TaxID=1871053 RepID=UPI0025DE0192|nr:hypothetical protein [Phenylobacterium sp.]